MKKIFTSAKKISFEILINKFLDECIVSRLERKSIILNESRGGEKIAIFANDHIGLHINNYGFYDRPGLDLLFDFLKPISVELKDGVALDVGANIGNHSMYFSNHFKFIYSFEPNPKTFCLLDFNSKSSINIYPMNYGLGDTEGLLELNQNSNNMGASSIVYNSSLGEKKIKVPIRRLDDIEVDDVVINFIKIDVEGYEYNAIFGGLNVIKDKQPLIVFEQHEKEFRNGTTSSIELLKSLGYRFCWRQSDNHNKNFFIRRLKNIINIIFRTPYKEYIMTGEVVPVAGYDMLIAVPVRFQNALGVCP